MAFNGISRELMAFNGISRELMALAFIGEDVWGCHYLLEEAMADCRSVFEDVYYLSLGLLTHSDLL